VPVRAAWRPLGASARRGGARGGQRGHCGRWEEGRIDAWSKRQRGAKPQDGAQGRARAAACSRGEAEEEERKVDEGD
jgi:hypothetical protein